MNKETIVILKVLRKIYAKTFNVKSLSRPVCEQDPDVASKLIYDKLIDDKPCMITRFGSTEMNAIVNYVGIKQEDKNILHYIRGKNHSWWWNESVMNKMQQWSGFFPSTPENLEKFCELMLDDALSIDILGSWLPAENFFEKELLNAHKVDIELLNPYFAHIPWTKALEGKKILVVHPFANSIEKQYKRKDLIFTNNLLPSFELQIVKAVQSIAGEKTKFGDWFDALNAMKKSIDSTEYDICLIGCGAYGLPLAAHVKRMGKKGVHLGGSLQLLFGIKGKRWENDKYNQKYNYSNLINENWVKPSDSEVPLNANQVEGACYW